MTLLSLLFSLPGGSQTITLALAVLVLGFWIKMIIEITTSNFEPKNLKMIWLLVTVFMGLLGAVIYYFAGRSSRIPKSTHF